MAFSTKKNCVETNLQKDFFEKNFQILVSFSQISPLSIWFKIKVNNKFV